MPTPIHHPAATALNPAPGVIKSVPDDGEQKVAAANSEVIQEIQRLSPDERRTVQAYLLQESRSRNPAWQAELARRIDEARAGRALNSAEIQASVAQASSER